MKKIPMIIDCDPGHDDIIAILLALGDERVDLRGITVTAGNNTLERTLDNTLKVLSHIGVSDIPVAAGASKFLFQPHAIATHVHGETGLDGPVLADATIKPSDMSAVEMMAKILSESKEKVTICPMGPLTNIATLLLAHTEVKEKIEVISFMGGAAIGGNVTACAEFNTWQDAEATYIVLHSGVKLSMLGLDVTLKAMIMDDEKEKLRQLGNKSGILAAELLDFFGKFHKARGRKGAPQHDACAVAWAIDPHMFIGQDLYVTMDLCGEFTRGCTVTDGRNRTKTPPNCHVNFDIDREKFVAMIYEAIKKLN